MVIDRVGHLSQGGLENKNDFETTKDLKGGTDILYVLTQVEVTVFPEVILV